MSFTRQKLREGVYLSAMYSDKFKTDYINVTFIRPLCREEAALNSLLPSVLRRGCSKYPGTRELQHKLQELYGANLNGFAYKNGEAHLLGMAVEYIANQFALNGENIGAESSDLLTEMLLNPLVKDGGFDSDFVATEKKNLIERIESQINDKGYYANKRCNEEMCKNEAYGISELGTIEEVQAITPESLFKYYKKVIASSKVEIYVIGRQGMNVFTGSSENLLNGVSRAASLEEVKNKVIRTAGEPRYITEELSVKQAKLVMGFRTGIVAGESLYMPLILMNRVYGSGTTSKLFANVREKMSLCYYCHSWTERNKGIMMVAAGVDESNYKVAVDEILLQLSNVAKGDFTDEEMEAAVNGLVNGFKSNLDSMGAMVSWDIGQILSGTSQTVEQAIEDIKKVTRGQIIEAAKGITLDIVYLLKGDGGEE